MLTLKFLLIIAIFALGVANGAGSPEPYYRLDNYDSRYKLLDDPPAPPEKTKQLNPSSLYKAIRPARIEKKPNYKRVEILPPAKRIGSDAKRSYRRIKVIPNKQALIRSGLPYYEPRAHFLLLGINSGVDLFSIDKKRVAVEIAGKIGWHYYFSDDDYSSAMRIYLNIGAPISTSSALSQAISGSINMDFLINAVYLDFFLGGGYGGDYYLKERFFANGFVLNAGISKEIDAHQIELGARVPFYSVLKGANGQTRHIVDIIIAWNYRF